MTPADEDDGLVWILSGLVAVVVEEDRMSLMWSTLYCYVRPEAPFTLTEAPVCASYWFTNVNSKEAITERFSSVWLASFPLR